MYENVSVIGGKAIRQYYHGTAWTDEAQAGEPLEFIGLTDSENTDLYVGDVVIDDNGQGVIEYVDDWAAFRVNYFGNSQAKWFHDYLPRERKNLLKIGNIHQQPELSEQAS